ncbi:AT-rich interactive domain-containing protein 6 [Morus notabilis]|uniref:AT-rich interactive domain-containing protein 6 n=1 Tax=Morus notabilis TaxID=981085 RepID=UPI000CED7AB4|nr:AT-rich interactive domain-containing protein 6 [Morus notabilis]XP_024020091.1 AT-rich interactive domain-containing protein 6 [Morus notabilis]
MEDKDSKQEGEDLGNGSEQRESQPSPSKRKVEAQTHDDDQVMRDRSDDQTANDGDAAGPSELPAEVAKCNGSDDTVVSDPPPPATAAAQESKDNKVDNHNHGEAEDGVTAEQPPESARHQNQRADADADANAEKFSTPKRLLNKNVGEVKNGFDDIEMAEAEEAESPEDGTPAQQVAFMKELENFHREKALEFKPPKFYGELLNCLKLWRAVIRLGGYEVVTASKLWRQVGESFHPPKTCTTVSWTFRIFYEKALLEYEKHKRQIGELQLPVGFLPQSSSIEKETSSYQAPGSGRTRRDAAARAMQGWHAQRLLGYGEVAEPIIKDKNINSASKREKNLKSIGSLKHKTPTNLENADKTLTVAADKQVVTSVVDIGPPADWVKINVRETKDCFEVYALVPGLLREEVRVQSDPAGRLVITGQPEQLDNPWGITPFQKVVSLPARIDPLHTSAVVSLHGRLFVRVPFEQGSV